VVPNRKQHEALGVLLEQRLICLFGFDSGGSGRLHIGRVLFWKIRNANNGLVDVLLVG